MNALLRWLASWPLGKLHTLGALLGWVTYLLSPTYRRRLRANADLAGLTPAQRRASVAQAGCMTAEAPWLWLRDGEVSPYCRWEGAELIEQAFAQGKGLVILTPHLGCFEITARAFAERWGAAHPLTVLYRPSRKAALRELEETARGRPGMDTAPATLAGVRQMLRALKRGETIGLLPDQVPPQGMGAWAPFFGRDAYTMTLAAKLVRQTGAQWLLMWAERLPGGRGFILRVSAPQHPLPGAGEPDSEALQQACARRINEEMERLIMLNPAQYLWGYHRYKAPRDAAAPPAAAGTQGPAQ
ncbi:lysophospholipid acyltransferase family protein [Azohydromonas lata]|uniref:lysophospholipid acyltransferase family protein n=1 Tax=Azohydromonas lata TaxID=45677 RepID=UPI00082FCAD6|nr:lysophospholipid acyltransferase family protein [Azohydromonas lata]